MPADSKFLRCKGPPGYGVVTLISWDGVVLSDRDAPDHRIWPRPPAEAASVPADAWIYDLQFRLRCRQCNRRDGFDIGILDTRHRGNSVQPRVERFIVAKEG